MGNLFQQRLPTQGHLYALFCWATSTRRQKHRLRRLPNALQNGKCEFYVEKKVIRAAWGFHHLFLNVKHVDDTPIRREIQQYLGSRPTYYRYMNGQLTLTPEQQADIIDIFRSYGYTEKLRFDYYVDRYSFE